MDHYDGNGWHQPGGQVIRNWKAEARKWVRNQVDRSIGAAQLAQNNASRPVSLPPIVNPIRA
jgi:hypothetical protein